MSGTSHLPDQAVRVVLVDTDPEARAGLSRRIAQVPGAELVGTTSRADDIPALLGTGSADAILLDLHLQDGEETRLCEEIRRLTDLPIYVLASFMTEERWRNVRAAGATAYLLKNIDTDQLVREIRQLTFADASKNGGAR